MIEQIRVTAQPSTVVMQVRVDVRDGARLDEFMAEVGDAVDFFVYSRCETCGFDLEDHVVVVGPFGHPFIWCERGGE